MRGAPRQLTLAGPSTRFDKGLRQLYFFVHEPDNTLAPELATYFIEKLNQACGFDLKPPKKYVQPVQGELF